MHIDQGHPPSHPRHRQPDVQRKSRLLAPPSHPAPDLNRARNRKATRHHHTLAPMTKIPSHISLRLKPVTRRSQIRPGRRKPQPRQ